MQYTEMLEKIEQIKKVLYYIYTDTVPTVPSIDAKRNGNTIIYTALPETDVYSNYCNSHYGDEIFINTAKSQAFLTDYKSSSSYDYYEIDIIDYTSGEDLEAVYFQYTLLFPELIALWATMISYFHGYLKGSKIYAFSLYLDELQTTIEIAEMNR